MKERITQIAKGTVSYDVPRFRIVPEQLTGELPKQQSVKREVEIRTCNGKPVKGVACSDCPHVQIKGGSFKGYVNRMTVEIDVVGLDEGEVLAGELVLLTDGGEFYIPYRYQVCGDELFMEEAGDEEEKEEVSIQGDTFLETEVWKEEVVQIAGDKPDVSEHISELIQHLLNCIKEGYNKAAMEELELALLIWKEEGCSFLTEAEEGLLEALILYHTGSEEESILLYEQVREILTTEESNVPWVSIVNVHMNQCMLLTEGDEGMPHEKKPLFEAVEKLIELQCTDSMYFPLYHEAACENMHSEELFAYYLNAMPSGNRKPVARPVVLYYSYGDSLSESLKELLYTNVQIFYSDEERIYAGYRSRLERFMIEHLLQRQMNENLLFLYTTLLHPDMLDERAAEALADLLCLEHICGEKEVAVQAVVRYPLLEQEWTYPLEAGEGDVPVWSQDAEVICLDAAGNETAGAGFTEHPVKRTLWLENQSMELRCRQLCPSHIRFLLADLQMLLNQGADTREELDRVIALANELPVSWETACRIVSMVITYCSVHPEETAYDGVLIGASWEDLCQEEQKQVFDLLLSRGYINEGEQRIRTYGWKQLPDESLAEFFRLRMQQSKKKDDWQTAMCYELYSRGSRESWILEELCAHYSNRQEKMLKLIQDCSECSQVKELGERLLAQSLYTGMWENLLQVMNCYLDAGGEDELLMGSYLVIRCQAYYMTGVSDAVLEEWFAYPSVQETFQDSLPEICSMALLKWYGEKAQRTEQEQLLCVSLLEGLLEQNRCYSFFHKYTESGVIPASLGGKTILEYHGPENRQIMLVFQRNELDTGEHAVLLKEQYPGVYCGAVSLFAGESLRCRLLEDGEYRAVCFTPEECFAGRDKGYVSLNQAILAYEAGDWQKVQAAVRAREVDRCILEQLFPLGCISEEG